MLRCVLNPYCTCVSLIWQWIANKKVEHDLNLKRPFSRLANKTGTKKCGTVRVGGRVQNLYPIERLSKVLSSNPMILPPCRRKPQKCLLLSYILFLAHWQKDPSFLRYLCPLEKAADRTDVCVLRRRSPVSHELARPFPFTQRTVPD